MRKTHSLTVLALATAMSIAGAAQAQRAGTTETVMTAEERADQAQDQAEQAKREAEAAEAAARAKTGDAHAAHQASIDAQNAAQTADTAADTALGAKTAAQEGNKPVEAAVQAGQARDQATNARLAAEAANASAQQAANPPPPPAEPVTMGDYDPAPPAGTLVAPPPGAKMLPQASAAAGVPVYITTSQANVAPNAHGVDFKGLDANGDGWLTKGEVTANAELAGAFGSVDIDNNGRLDRDEVNDW
jgi:hypothetical protein